MLASYKNMWSGVHACMCVVCVLCKCACVNGDYEKFISIGKKIICTKTLLNLSLESC